MWPIGFTKLLKLGQKYWKHTFKTWTVLSGHVAVWWQHKRSPWYCKPSVTPQYQYTKQLFYLQFWFSNVCDQRLNLKNVKHLNSIGIHSWDLNIFWKMLSCYSSQSTFLLNSFTFLKNFLKAIIKVKCNSNNSPSTYIHIFLPIFFSKRLTDKT